LIAAAVWWLGAILDAADGDLARFKNVRSKFGGWFDSFLDRCKEYLIFAVFGYCAWLDYSNPLFLLLGVLSIFSNVMSGYVTDTKKLFMEGKRSPSVKVGKKFIFGMVDTRDFFVILSLCIGDIRIALCIYGTIFTLMVFAQILLFCKRFGSAK
jgi:CDP-L-myo-inositol myo-inositolphosphotransferase